MEALCQMIALPELDDLLQNDGYKSIRDAVEHLNKRCQDEQDRGGIITASRTLIETVIKTLLDLMHVEYPKGAELPDVSKQLFRSLDLHPSTQTSGALKQLCQGAMSMCNGLACLRNAHSDAHGTGREANSLPLRDAYLCAYISCVLTSYCVQAYESKVSRKTRHNLSESQVDTLSKIWTRTANRDKIKDPDQLPYSQTLEDIAHAFTQETEIILKLQNLRKAGKLR